MAKEKIAVDFQSSEMHKFLGKKFAEPSFCNSYIKQKFITQTPEIEHSILFSSKILQIDWFIEYNRIMNEY